MNRNSTPEANTASSLRPPQARNSAAAQHTNLRASADMAAMVGNSPASRIRPSSDFYGQSQGQGQGGADADPPRQDDAAMDRRHRPDFKDELSAIEQWFRVLSEAERTAALYALLQQTTQVQIRFFIQVLQQMGKSHPMSGVLSPANFDKDPMTNRLSDAMGKLNVNSTRNSMSQAQSSTKRHSGLDPSTINAMFPDAAAAIATEKAKFTQQTGNQPPSNRNSTAVDVRNSLAAPTIAEESNGQNPSSPWEGGRPKSSSGQPPHGTLGGGGNIQNTTLTTGDKQGSDLPLLSPYTAGGNWASMVNTPMVPNFQQGGHNQADMVANATAMKLAALSTVNNRFALDDVRKYRRARSNDAPGANQNPLSPGVQAGGIPNNVVMINEHGQVISRDQMIALQNQQMGSFGARSRPSSPGIAMQGGFPGGAMPFASPQNNGFLGVYDGNPLLSGGLGGMGQMGLSPEGYLSDHSDMNRGRSPRGRRGTSKPPEDPTDPTLLQDIPAWLRSLRLHKYTDNLKDLKWTDLVELDDEALEKRGVNALGARRKMLKVFEQVKEAKADGKLA
ncbi:SAM domain-containing protein [Apiospora arundinis]